MYIMTRHFIPTISERKYRKTQEKQNVAPLPKKTPKMSIWVFRGKPKPTDTNQTYIVSLEQSVDPNIFHEGINRLIPDTMVKVDNPNSPQSCFIVTLSRPLTLSEIYSKTSEALKGLI